jgi:hypothetical protein
MLLSIGAMGLIREEEEIRNLRNLEAKLREENLKLAQERQTIAAQVREQKRDQLIKLGIHHHHHCYHHHHHHCYHHHHHHHHYYHYYHHYHYYHYYHHHYYYHYYRKTIRIRFTTIRNATTRNGKELEQEEVAYRETTIRVKSDRK